MSQKYLEMEIFMEGGGYNMKFNNLKVTMTISCWCSIVRCANTLMLFDKTFASLRPFDEAFWYMSDIGQVHHVFYQLASQGGGDAWVYNALYALYQRHLQIQKSNENIHMQVLVANNGIFTSRPLTQIMGKTFINSLMSFVVSVWFGVCAFGMINWSLSFSLLVIFYDTQPL